MIQKNESQGKLSFVARTADTSIASAKSAHPKQSRRRLAIENHLLIAGKVGLTRYELADRLHLPIQSITGPVRVMLDSGVIAETGERRPSPHGAPAKILVLARYKRSTTPAALECRS